jgi:hypothetical protein
MIPLNSARLAMVFANLMIFAKFDVGVTRVSDLWGQFFGLSHITASGPVYVIQFDVAVIASAVTQVHILLHGQSTKSAAIDGVSGFCIFELVLRMLTRGLCCCLRVYR